MGVACGTHGEKRHAYILKVGKPENRDHLEELRIAYRIILKWTLEVEWEVVHWIKLAQETEKGELF
jgi:hypothetical protein